MTRRRPVVRVFHRPAGWLHAFLSPDVQDCTRNHQPAHKGKPRCTATAVWKVVEQHPMHLTVSFWCNTHLPTEHRTAAA